MLLLCEECMSASTGSAAGWRAYRAADEEDGDDDEVVLVFCQACSDREFGPLLRREPGADEG